MSVKLSAIYTCMVCGKSIAIDFTESDDTIPDIPEGWQNFKGDELCDNCVNAILSYVGKGKEISVASAVK